MAIETLRPNAAGDLSAWTAVGDSTLWECVDESSPDDDTTYASIPALNDLKFLVHLASSGIGASDTINSVALTLRLKTVPIAPSSDLYFLWKENSVETQGALITETTSYADYTETRTVRPSDSSAWTLSDLNNLQVGVRGVTGTRAARCTQVYVTVDYTPLASSVKRSSLPLLGVG